MALRAVQIGEELGLTPGRLRVLAIGGLLQDIGKLSVPERTLGKLAELAEAEFAVIKRHPSGATACCASSTDSRSRCGGSSAATTSGWTGTAFDERCVEALERILDRELPAALVA